MASLLEELKLLELPAPAKFDVEDLADELTAAKVIEREDLIDDEEKSNSLSKSCLRKKTAILLADSDKRYAGQKISRKDLLKSRGESSEDEESLEKESSASELETATALEKTGKSYESLLSEGRSNESGDSYDNEDENKTNGWRGDESMEGSKQQEGDEVEDSEEEFWEEGEEFDYEQEEDKEEEEEGVPRLKNVVEEEDRKEGIQKFSSVDADEVQKGKAVVHQIGLWDSLLEHRIRMQKSLVQINKLPQHDVLDEFCKKGGNQLREPLNNVHQMLTNLLHNLLVLQQTLLTRNTDTKLTLNSAISDKVDKMEDDEDIPSDFDEEGEKENEEEGDEEDKALEEGLDQPKDESETGLMLPRKRKQTVGSDDYSSNIAKRHAAFEQFRDSTIKKWNEKTRLASGKVNSKSFSSFDRSTLIQIKQILADRERLIRRTQLKRSAYRVFGKVEDSEARENVEQRDAHLKDYDTEIFDDDDFYHQLLREFIERKSNVDPNDPIAMGRYDVHAKLVSFMAPQNRGTMPDSSRNELFSSLFGKRHPSETGDIALCR